MDVKVFRTFLELASVRHFGRAADNLYLTQAAVSARIKQLETYFDTQLFIRDRNNIKLTAAGERLVDYAEVMVATLQQAKFELSLETGKALELSVGGTPMIWDAYLQRCFSQFTDVFMGHQFAAEVMSREQLSRGVVDRSLDVVFTFDAIKAEELACKQVSHVCLVFVSTQPDSCDSVFQHRYISVQWGKQFSSEHTKRHPEFLSPCLKTSSARIALDLILEKGGSAYLPEQLVEPLLLSRQLYIVGDTEKWELPVYMSYRKKSASIETILQVEALVTEHLNTPSS